MSYRGLCFDLDGTLINSISGALIRICKVAKTMNLPVNAEIEARMRTMWGQSAADLIKSCWPKVDIDKFQKQWGDLDANEPFLVFPGTKEALKELSKKFYLTILTNRNFESTMIQLKYNDLLQFFGLVIAGDSGPYKKPDPRSLDRIFQYSKDMGANPKEIILIGDTVEGDWKLAQAVGIEFFAVLSGGMDTREKFLAAGVPNDRIINSVADLPDILLKPC